jgi:O-antigen/teichoic acid export membrane protein
VFSYTGIVNSLSIALFSVLLIPHFGVFGFVSAMFIANFITGAFTFVYSRSYRYLSLRDFDTRKLKEMLAYSIPLMPTAIMWWLVSGLNRPLVEQYCGLYALGLLAVAGKLPSIMNLSFNMFQQAWTVTVLQEYGKESFEGYNNSMFRLIFSTQAIVCMCVTVAARPFILIMTTPEYMEAWKYIPLITIGTLFSNISAFMGTVFTASRKSIYVFVSAIAGGVSSVLFNFLLIPRFGVWGACMSIILAHLCSAISRIYFSNRFVPFHGMSFAVRQLFIVVMCYVCCYIPDVFLRFAAQAGCFLIWGVMNWGDVKRLMNMAVEKVRKRKNR